jgi:hypothetical protein
MMSARRFIRIAPPTVKVRHPLPHDLVALGAEQGAADPGVEQLASLRVLHELRRRGGASGVKVGADAIWIVDCRVVDAPAAMLRQRTPEVVSSVGTSRRMNDEHTFEARHHGREFVDLIPGTLPRRPGAGDEHGASRGVHDRRDMPHLEKRIDRVADAGNRSAPHGDDGFGQQRREHGDHGWTV